MKRLVSIVLATAGLLVGGNASAQGFVSLTGEWYQFNGPSVNIPFNPPVIPCNPAVDRGCPTKVALTGTTNNKPSFGVPGAGTIMGGLNVGDPFEIEPGMFTQNLGSQFDAIPFNFAVQQINTRFSFRAPATSRASNPPANTRQFQANAWSQPGNGQTGRMSADSSAVSADGKTTVTYTAGSNAFGGTMHLLNRGPGEIYLNGAVLGSASFPVSLQPLVGIVPIGTSLPSGPYRARALGIGWAHTTTGMQATGVAKGGAVFAAPCTVLVPPTPAGCERVLDTGFTTVFPLSPATSVLHGFPFTTGAVKVAFVGTVAGNPGTFTISATGKDTTTPGGVRNISLVAGSYQVRTDGTGVGITPNIGMVELSFVPEPASVMALAAGVGLLGLMGVISRGREGSS